jgi:hypothetical protein
VWANRQRGGGYDIVLLGTAEAAPVDVAGAQARLEDGTHALVAQSLREVGFDSAARLFGTFVGRAAALRTWTAGAEINRDASLHLQYLAGMKADVYAGDAIYRSMLAAVRTTTAPRSRSSGSR